MPREPATAVATTIFVGASSITVAAAQGDRTTIRFHSPSGVMFLGYGATAVQLTPRLVPAGEEVEERDWKGQINAIAASGVGTAPLYVTELI